MTDQTQDTRRDGAEPSRPPIPDLGFFAGSPAPSAGSPAFGGSPVGAAPSPFGTPAAPPFGAPAGPAFGTPAPFGSPVPFDTPPPWGASGAHHGGRSGWSGRTMALVAAAGVIVLVAVVFAGRFGWQQFVADPVTPDTLMGQPKVSGADGAQVAAEFRSNMGAEFAAGTTSAVAFYSDGRGLGYLLVAVRGGGGKPSGSSGAGSSDPFAGWSKSTAEGATCYSKPAQVAAGAGVTFCVRSLWRRAVVVLGIADLPPDPATVALATNQAWDAQ